MSKKKEIVVKKVKEDILYFEKETNIVFSVNGKLVRVREWSLDNYKSDEFDSDTEFNTIDMAELTQDERDALKAGYLE